MDGTKTRANHAVNPLTGVLVRTRNEQHATSDRQARYLCATADRTGEVMTLRHVRCAAHKLTDVVLGFYFGVVPFRVLVVTAQVTCEMAFNKSVQHT